MSESEQERRGTCCHEAGHAVVLHTYHVPVEGVWVKFTKEKGWHGETEPGDTPDDLQEPVQFVIWTAGKMAEELFDCRAHDRTWGRDYGEIESRLDRKGLSRDERNQLIDEAEMQARAILSHERDAVLRVFHWLVEHECLDGDTFERLMRGEP
jgi:hypothetical protein